MTDHKTYSLIVDAIKSGDLREPFSKKDFMRTCPGLPQGTYNAFLWKHRKGNPREETELFFLVSPGKFKVIRPFKYDIG